MSTRLLKCLCCCMILVFPAATMLADASAVLAATGQVMVNGSALPRSSAIFAGDRIQTANDATGMLTLKGSTVLLGGNSMLVYDQQAVQLDCGSVLVSTTAGMRVQAGKVRVNPVRAGAKYAMLEQPGSLQIAAREGNLEVENGGERLLLTAGRELSLPGGCMMKAAEGSLPDAGEGAAEPQPQAAGTVIAGLSENIGLVIGLIAVAVATGISVAATRPSSPSKP